MDALIAFLKAHFYWVLIAVGTLVVIGCLFDWHWITRMAPNQLVGLRAFVESLHGEQGRYRFERFVMFCVGVLLILLGAGYAWLFAK